MVMPGSGISVKARNLVSPEDALLFDDLIDKWQVRLNLSDWRIERGSKAARNAMASVEFNDGARLATYRLGDFGAEVITPASLESTAIHELLHVFLHDLLAIAAAKPDPEALEAAEHRVVNVLESLLLECNHE